MTVACVLPKQPMPRLFERVLDLLPGHVLGDDNVVERLDGERLAVGDLARRFAAADLGVSQRRTNSTGFMNASCDPAPLV